MSKEILNRHDEEDQRSALAEEKREEIRHRQLLEMTQKADERKELRSRIDYYRNAKSTNHNHKCL